MEIVVRKAEPKDFHLAWALYRPFLEEYVRPKINPKLEPEAWIQEERISFEGRWVNGKQYIIDFDRERGGWAMLGNCNNTVHVENVMVREKFWIDETIRFLVKELATTFEKERRLVQVPVLDSTPMGKEVLSALEDVGFEAAFHDGMAQTMVANWSK